MKTSSFTPALHLEMIVRFVNLRSNQAITALSAAPHRLRRYYEASNQVRRASHLPDSVTRTQSFDVENRPLRVIFSGIQPTGVPHLGNYLGALQQWVQLQNEPSPNTRLFYCVVDLHAITLSQDPQRLRRWRRETLAALLAVGLDPDRCTVFFQSSVGKASCLPVKVSSQAVAERPAGTRTLRIDVDFELYRFCRIFVPYDAVEGSASWRSLSHP